MDRGQEATGGAIEGEASVLPGRALTQSRESLHVPPDRSGIRLVLLGQCVRLSGLLLRQIRSRRDRIEELTEAPVFECGARPDASNVRSSSASACVLTSPVSMVRSSVRSRRARAAS